MSLTTIWLVALLSGATTATTAALLGLHLLAATVNIPTLGGCCSASGSSVTC